MSLVTTQHFTRYAQPKLDVLSLLCTPAEAYCTSREWILYSVGHMALFLYLCRAYGIWSLASPLYLFHFLILYIVTCAVYWYNSTFHWILTQIYRKCLEIGKYIYFLNLKKNRQHQYQILSYPIHGKSKSRHYDNIMNVAAKAKKKREKCRCVSKSRKPKRKIENRRANSEQKRDFPAKRQWMVKTCVPDVFLPHMYLA